MVSCLIIGSGRIAYFSMKKDKFELKGLVVPVPTPFSEAGAIDLGAFLSHLDWLAECGVENLLLNGTTGEFFSQTPAEQIDLLKIARENWAGSLMFHVGASSLRQGMDAARAAEEEGADCIASLPPFYFKGAPPTGLVEWFSTLSAAISCPFIIYNFPKHTGNSLTAEMLTQIPHWGLKDSSGDLSLIPSTPNYFIGGDPKITEAYALGAAGFVSAASNIDPKPYLQMAESQTPELQLIINEVNKQASGSFAIARIKKKLSEILPGYPPFVRPPLARVCD